MNRNIIIATIVIIILIIIGIVVWAQPDQEMPMNTMDTDTQTGTSTDSSETNATSTTPGMTYTMADVASHNNASSCWSVVQGSVYDLTTWINRHPGGKAAILSLCGKDGTSAFTSQHGGQQNPEQTLASFKIGAVAQ